MKLDTANIDLGLRARPDPVVKSRWTSVGVSQAREVVVADFAGQEHDVFLSFQNKSESLKNSTETYLNDTVKNMGACSITLDAGDDLGVQALGTSGGVTTALRYVGNSFSARHVIGTRWDIHFTLRYYA